MPCLLMWHSLAYLIASPDSSHPPCGASPSRSLLSCPNAQWWHRHSRTVGELRTQGVLEGIEQDSAIEEELVTETAAGAKESPDSATEASKKPSSSKTSIGKLGRLIGQFITVT